MLGMEGSQRLLFLQSCGCWPLIGNCSMRQGTVLTVDSDSGMLDLLEDVLKSHGYGVVAARSVSAALELLRTRPFECVVADAAFCHDVGFSLLGHISNLQLTTPVIVLSDRANIADAVRFVKMGAAYYLPKTQIHARVPTAVVEAAARRVPQQAGASALAVEEDETPGPLRGFLGRHYRIRQVLRAAAAAAQSQATILMEGESGTGKTLLAGLIHSASSRRDGPFVEVNCGALPENLLNSELFGHERGSFTSSTGKAVGKFEHAGGGTIFLDGISNAPPSLQMKLLRVVEDRVIERIGSTVTIKVDVRIMTASNQPLAEEVRRGRFRRDLYHRLRVITVALPPLRERITDVPILAEQFLRILAEKHGKETEAFSRQAMQALLRYYWPGNVRELRNAVEHSVVMCPGEEIQPHHLPLRILAQSHDLLEGVLRPKTLRRARQDFERGHLRRILKKTNGNKQQAAALLQICRATLYKKIAKYDLAE